MTKITFSFAGKDNSVISFDIKFRKKVDHQTEEGRRTIAARLVKEVTSRPMAGNVDRIAGSFHITNIKNRNVVTCNADMDELAFVDMLFDAAQPPSATEQREMLQL
jgi:hypothetical protein